MVNLVKLQFFLVNFHKTNWIIVVSIDGPVWLWIYEWSEIFSVSSSSSYNMNWIGWFKEGIVKIIVGYFVVVHRESSFWKLILFVGVRWTHCARTLTVRVFVSAQTKINFIFVEDFFKTDFDAIKCSVSMKGVFSQTSAFNRDPWTNLSRHNHKITWRSMDPDLHDYHYCSTLGDDPL